MSMEMDSGSSGLPIVPKTVWPVGRTRRFHTEGQQDGRTLRTILESICPILDKVGGSDPGPPHVAPYQWKAKISWVMSLSLR